MSNTASIIRPKLTGSNTSAKVVEQGYTYNQAGFTYNQVGVMYGGVYNVNEDIAPSIFTYSDIYTHPAIPPGPNNQKPVGPGWFLYVAQI